MSDIVIKAENLGKKYVIGHQMERGGYTALRDVMMQNARTLWSKTKDLATGKPIIQGDTMEEVWALRDVSFEIHRGEAMGIIGRNGAGKSTLLKILSRITEPSTGRVTTKGRVASLLEVGTGFHPELTGRENIYLNGTILGMTRAEINRKFDEIVAFAEVEKYLDTPVKRYSSGMYVRLAFAVAAHLEPEILVVDEVLAVGDAAFQKKCLGKMEDVAKKGRTVLFVSHNLDAVSTLCPKSILLLDGLLKAMGSTGDIITQYLGKRHNHFYNCDLHDQSLEDSFVKLLKVRFVDRSGSIVQTLQVDREFGIEMTFIIKATGQGFRPGPNFLISTVKGIKVFQSLDTATDLIQTPGRYKSIAWIPANFLNNTSYVLTVALTTHNPVFIHCQTEIGFDVDDNINAITRGDYRLEMHGVVRPYIDWKTTRI